MDLYIFQAFFRLLESEVSVQLRKADKAVVEGLLPSVQARYEEATKQTVRVVILDEYLAADR